MTRSPWWWVPSLYFGQGLPYVVVMTVSVVMFKNLGISNTDIALATSWLYLPWVIKPLWSPLVDLLQRKRWWIVTLQAVIGAALASTVLVLPLPGFFQASLALLWLMAFASATHDIAADGFYMLALPQHQQAAFVGVRSLFYRASMIAGQGALVMLAGRLMAVSGDPVRAWQVVMALLAGMFVLLLLWHRSVLPRPPQDHRGGDGRTLWGDFTATFASFFRRHDIGLVLGFLLTFRLGEAQLVKLVTPFMLDPASAGGLGLSTEQVGLLYGTVGVASLTAGGLLGGWVVSLHGLRRWLWPMVAAIHLPNLLFVALAVWQPASVGLVGAAVACEQFGYGFGFAAYLLYMILVADGPTKTAHYALCTGFMALGMMLPGMVSGWLQQTLGYPMFFGWVCVATLPSVWLAAKLGIPPQFGRKETTA
jgi:PAT family beta-lactamase induction signal transducer AmpG